MLSTPKIASSLVLVAATLVIQEPNAVGQGQASLGEPLFSFGAPIHETHFNLIWDYCLSSGDTLYILDRREREVTAFHLSGEQLLSFGNRGMGPGEFEDPNSLYFSDHCVFVGDHGIPRITRFTSEGEYLHTITLPNLPHTFVVIDDIIYMSTPATSRAIIWKISLMNPERAEPYLTFDHPLVSQYKDKLPHGRIMIDAKGTSLCIAMPVHNAVIIGDVNTDTADWRLIHPNGSNIDEHRDHFAGVKREVERRGAGTSWSPFRRAIILPDGNIFLEMIMWKDGDSRGIGIIIDPQSGEQISGELTPQYSKSYIARLLRDNLIGFVYHDLEQLTLYNFPPENS